MAHSRGQREPLATSWKTSCCDSHQPRLNQSIYIVKVVTRESFSSQHAPTGQSCVCSSGLTAADSVTQPLLTALTSSGPVERQSAEGEVREWQTNEEIKAGAAWGESEEEEEEDTGEDLAKGTAERDGGGFEAADLSQFQTPRGRLGFHPESFRG